MRESVTYQAILEEGREEGRVKGREEGRVKGREEGRVEGREEGREEGRVEGRVEGREEGRVEELHRTILRLGRERFGEADQTTRQDIEAITDIEALEELSLRLLKVSSWAELLSRQSA